MYAKGQALLVYLAITGRRHSRQALAGLLWSDVDELSARASLRTTLVQLRRALGGYVTADRQTVGLDRGRSLWVDVQSFEDACRRLHADKPGGRGELADTVSDHCLHEHLCCVQERKGSDFCAKPDPFLIMLVDYNSLTAGLPAYQRQEDRTVRSRAIHFTNKHVDDARPGVVELGPIACYGHTRIIVLGIAAGEDVVDLAQVAAADLGVDGAGAEEIDLLIGAELVGNSFLLAILFGIDADLIAVCAQCLPVTRIQDQFGGTHGDLVVWLRLDLDTLQGHGSQRDPVAGNIDRVAILVQIADAIGLGQNYTGFVVVLYQYRNR